MKDRGDAPFDNDPQPSAVSKPTPAEPLVCSHAADCICVEINHAHCCGDRRANYLARSAPAEALDVERLAMAISAADGDRRRPSRNLMRELMETAEAIAAEYARLSSTEETDHD